MITPVHEARQALADLELAIIQFSDKAIHDGADSGMYAKLRSTMWSCAKNLTKTPVSFGSEINHDYKSSVDYMTEHVHHSLGQEFGRILWELLYLLGFGGKNNRGLSFAALVHSSANPRELMGRAIGHLEILFLILNRLEVMEQLKEDRGIQIKKSERYVKQRAHHYKEYGSLIDHAENKVEAACSVGHMNRRKVTDKIRGGNSKWGGYYHAWLAEPLGDHRIVYAFDHHTKTVVYQTIGKHKELGLGRF